MGLKTVRTRGGKKITEKAWHAILKTDLRDANCGSNNIKVTQPGAAANTSYNHNNVTQPAVWDTSLRETRGWYESAYKWRTVSYAMHAQARLDIHDSRKVMFYVAAVDKPAAKLTRKMFDEMLAFLNVSTTSKLPSFLHFFQNMEMIFTESVLPL